MHHHHPLPSTASTTVNASSALAVPPAASSNNAPSGASTAHAQQRRRKKRPNYGTRIVEVQRGYNGFGFTISGQQPCRLSCIVTNSPADQAGLRAGDFLISVNGLNVSKMPHETVVQLIGNSFGSIRMQIAENYYSDSSDEENAALMLQQHGASNGLGTLASQLALVGASGGARAKPRYLHHKTKMHRLRNSPQKKRTATFQQEQQQLLLAQQQQQHTQMQRAAQMASSAAILKPMELQTLRPLMEDLPLPQACKAQPLSRAPKTALGSSDVANVSAMVRVPTAALEYRAIVGYLGTIEMPKQISHSSKLQTVRSCIRKLRQEKRQPTTVLITILPDCLRLQSASGSTLASYASERLNYVSSSSESENRFFGLVTSAVHTAQVDEEDDDVEEDEEPLAQPPTSSGTGHISISNSCHVFVVDTKLVEHQVHMPRAAEFRIHCTRDPISNLCLEFPNNSEYVVNLIRSMYTMRILPPASRHTNEDHHHANGQAGGGGGPAAAAHSPQPSNHSEISTTTSNSDSGIGFHNDCTNISDRILVVDFPGAAELRMRPQAARPLGIFNNFDPLADKRLTVRAMPDPKTPPPADARPSHSRAPNLLANFNLIKSPANSLTTTRSCDDVLTLVEGAEAQPQLLLPHASMDDISLHSTAATSSYNMTCSEEHLFLHPATCVTGVPKSRATYSLLQDCRTGMPRIARQSLGSSSIPDKLSPQVFGVLNTGEVSTAGTRVAATTRHSMGFPTIDNAGASMPAGNFDLDTWKSLQDLRATSESEFATATNAGRAPEGVISEPDLVNPSLPANASPFRRAWGQSSFRTPRSDKHTLVHQPQPSPAHSHQQLSPLVRRAASMTASDNDVYIKSIHRGYVEELKQMRSQQQNPNMVAALNSNNKAPPTASTTTNQSNASVSALKVPQIRTEPPPKPAASNGAAAGQQPTVSGVAAWGSSFERLLEDPAGLHTFAVFLKKEFSAENIYFWTACERFRHLENASERVSQAMAIFQKHLANGASEPVNVDSQARNLTQEKLQSGETDIFAHAQKQIFNLMKFDSYQRFIRSDLYKSCVEAEEKRQPLPYGADTLDELLKTHNKLPVNSSVSKLKKSASNAEDRCRKSLLPWHRKTSSKSRERSEADPDKSKLPPLSSQSLKLPSAQNSLSDIHSSRSSLSSFEGLTGASIVPGTCRVILSDASTTVVQTRPGETVAQLVDRLLEKRGLTYHFYDVVAKGTTKSIDLQSSAEALIGKDVLIEQRVAFKLDLPDRKVISVKSKPKKQLHEVIRPILHKYNYDMNAVQVLMRETQAPVDLAQAVTVADGQRLQTVWLKPPPLLSPDCQYSVRGGVGGGVGGATKMVLPKSVTFPSNSKGQTGAGALNGGSTSTNKTAQSTLDEITNKVFNELMQGKGEAHSGEKQQPKKASDQCSLKSDDCASETSSIFERIRRRDPSVPMLKLKLKKKSTSSQHSEEPNQSSSNNTNASTTTASIATPAVSNVVDIKKPIIAKLKAGVKLQVTERVAENQDELLEGLKRAQLARLEDQRGTEINSELPDFLKNKENLSAAASKLRKVRANLRTYPPTAEESSVPSTPQSPQSPSTPAAGERPQPAPRLSITNKLKNAPISPMKVDEEDEALTFQQSPTTPVDNVNNCSSLESDFASSCKGPPPLPPKPKVLPIKPSNWGVNAQTATAATTSPTTYKSYSSVVVAGSLALLEAEATEGKLLIDMNRKSLLGASEQQARCAYLEEPSSSFV